MLAKAEHSRIPFHLRLTLTLTQSH